MAEFSLLPLSDYSWCLFPWLGTRSFRTLRKLIATAPAEFGIHSVEYEGCYYISFKMEKAGPKELLDYLYSRTKEGIDRKSLLGKNEVPVFEKYDGAIPLDLLRDAYAKDKLRTDELEIRIPQILKELGD
jgi:ATP-dependent Lhr-like helicase